MWPVIAHFNILSGTIGALRLTIILPIFICPLAVYKSTTLSYAKHTAFHTSLTALNFMQHSGFQYLSFVSTCTYVIKPN